jgi:hypothetical protein
MNQSPEKLTPKDTERQSRAYRIALRGFQSSGASVVCLARWVCRGLYQYVQDGYCVRQPASGITVCQYTRTPWIRAFFAFRYVIIPEIRGT